MPTSKETRVRVEFTELPRGGRGVMERALLPLRARQRGVAVVSFGLHFDNHASNSSKGTRAEFNDAVEQVLALDGR